MILAMVARGDRGGLAAMCDEFHRHMHPARTLLINTNLGRGPVVTERFPGAVSSPGMNDDLPVDTIHRVCAGADVIWSAETFYRADFCDHARQAGCRTVLHAMPELFGGTHSPADVTWTPTGWRTDLLPGDAHHVPFPVARDRLPFRRRTKAEVFLHVAAPAMLDRNGTQAVLAALRWVRHPILLLVRGQTRPARRWRTQVGRVTIRRIDDEHPDYWQAWSDEADVLLLPRRYAGQCLPANEAASLGMPVVMTAIDPQLDWFHPETLVPARQASTARMGGGQVAVHDVSARALAEVIDRLAGSPSLVAAASDRADLYAESISWGRWAPRYRAMFDAVAAGEPLHVPAG